MYSDLLPADTDTDTVRPFVYEDERTVSMHFDIQAIQSRMRRHDPYSLDLDYTRTMMGFLLFVPQPRRILMIGLGGGSLPKYCHKYLEGADVTVVEINPHVIAMREAFHVPPDGERFRVVHADGARFLERAVRLAHRYDVVLVDGFNYDGQPRELCTREFYDGCRAVLQPAGLLVANLHAAEPACGEIVARVAASFDGALHSIPVADGGNRIVFAGAAEQVVRLSAVALRARWSALGEVHRRTLRTAISRIEQALRGPVPADS